jgi:fermentation-respiration switch protein FrsA (DUF1100 family)
MNVRITSTLIGTFGWKRLIRSFILVPIFVVLGLVIMAFISADRVIFQPPTVSYTDGPEIIKLDRESSGTVAAKFYENPQAEYTILFSHGNAEDIGTIEPFIQKLRDLGFNVLTYDYRGYGLSSGSPSEENAYADIAVAYRYLIIDRSIEPTKVIVHGRSLGGAVAAELAANENVGGLILESTFTSAFRVVTRYPIIPFDKFNTRAKINKVACPVLVIHGTNDLTIPIYHARELLDSVNGPKYSFFVEGAGHNDLFVRSEKGYLRAITDFVRTLSTREKEPDARPTSN